MSKKYRKATIPKAVKEQVWIKQFGETFKTKCCIDWCHNDIDVFNFHVGHDIPESKGGTLNLNNLYPICPNCNRSMSDLFTIISSIDGLPNMKGIWNELSASEEVEMNTEYSLELLN